MPIQLGTQGQVDFSQPIDLLEDCHRRVESFLQMLQRVAAEAPREALDDEHRRALAAGLEYFATAAPRHTEDEEDSLFPRLRESQDPRAAELLERVEKLEADHETAQPLHQQVDNLGRQWLKDGQLDNEQRQQLRHVLEQLEALYQQHIALEDQEVFPLARQLLDQPMLNAVGREMQHRRGL